MSTPESLAEVEAVSPSGDAYAPLLAVIVARKVKTVWHISLAHLVKPNPARSAVKAQGPMRIASARADRDLADEMRAQCGRLGCAGILVNATMRSGRRFVAYCPEHGDLGRNTSEEFAGERVLLHYRTEHGEPR